MDRNQIVMEGGNFVVPADLLGVALGVEPASVPEMMRNGQITSRCETGKDKDAGTYRLTFYHARNALRLIVNEKGEVLKRSRFATPGRNPTPEKGSGE
ncbi:DUF6522 family protein [Paracoccus litorisediminis]|uniref:Uncharacterized protein n=1 Tax=Paracoccus litorisediminis TaxID=2006130 RepID=A0A844HP88_9RHOB|nr:DUF6522 family protein [Paracoccus litorisediminis]MTH61710.1 hypothetical protein [Paracoccus litorisediminis]